MRLGAFELIDPVPKLNKPYVFATLRPWIDVNNVGSIVLKEIQRQFAASELGRIAKPDRFYDFTRYRPVITIESGINEMSIPNTTIHYARREGQNDLILLDLLEPHSNAHLYVDSVLKFLTRFETAKYILLGSMYDVVPHTRPLLVSGYGMGNGALQDIRRVGAMPITYHGPSTYANLITKKAAESGIDSAVFIVSLPQYVVMEEDYLGKVRLMEVLNTLYNIPIDKEEIDRAVRQRQVITERLKDSPEIAGIMSELEDNYDMRVRSMEEQGIYQLGSDMEDMFWRSLDGNIGKA
ncbi:MAG: putative ATP-dependent carboligase, ATP-grasp superfamily [Deltaproteobacteria bacterium]|nr:putative ATP-dependent carboligase, ATP-grasp superfamily [Deltaproteobacteria bacterium]